MRPFLVWAGALAFLTLAGVGWLWATGVNPALDFSGAIVLVGYAPALAAVLAVALVRGRRGLRSFGGQFLRWRVSTGWYAVALIGPFLLVLVAILLSGHNAVGDSGGVAALTAAAGSLVAGSLGEEPGWRGLAHPALRRRWGFLSAGLAVGLIWALWHQWILLAPGGAFSAPDVVINTGRLVATAVVYGWLYETTSGSLPVVMVAHLGHNLAVAVLVPESVLAQGLIAVGYVVVAAIVTAGRRHAPRPARPLRHDRSGSPRG